MGGLSEWDSFYVIVGSAAGALIGLQFVVLTLIADRPVRDFAAAGAAFATPTIVHFTTALLLSAVLRAPWASAAGAAIAWGLIAAGGAVYIAFVVRRVRVQQAYRPQLEDWVFHVALPLAAYLALLAAAVVVKSHERRAFFGVGAATLSLLFIGIHNAWDAVAYHVFVATNPTEAKTSERDPREP